jgi:hypothetical protein
MTTCGRLNILNLKLQGRDKQEANMTSAKDIFKSKLLLWKPHLDLEKC